MSANNKCFMNCLLKKVVPSFLFGILLTAHTSANDKEHPYCCTSVASNSRLAKLGEVDFSIFAAMSAGNFFQGLEYKKVQSAGRSAAEFYKDRRAVSLFPEELEIVVGFHTLASVKNKPSRRPSIADLDDLSRSLEFEASWKTGVELRSAELIAPPELSRKPSPLEHGIIGWSYTLRVHARDVPLTDHLVISVFGPYKEFVSRVTFDLTSDLIPPPVPIR